MPELSMNAQCILKILEGVGSLTTAEILDAASSAELKDLCHDCAGGDAFIAAANLLVNEGLIAKKFGKGGYRWHLVRNQ